MEPAPKQIGVGDVLGESFTIYRENAAALIGGALVVFLVVAVASWLLQNEGGLILGTLAAIIRLVGYAIFTGFVVRLVQDVRDGRRDHSIGDLFSAASPAIVPLIAFGILFAIGVGIGFLLLIIPGFFLLTMWSVGAPAIVIEDEGPIGAFGRSWELVRGEGWAVFGVLVVTLLIVLAVGIVLGAIATPIGDGEVATLVAAIVSSALTAPVFALVVSVLFFELGGGPEAAGVREPVPTS
jgi:hypothetical protein